MDADVAEEAERQRKRCAACLRQAGGGSAAAAPAEAVLLPAQLAVLPVAGDGQDGAGAAGSKRATAEGEELSLAGRPYAVEMFGLSKAYKVRAACHVVAVRHCCLLLAAASICKDNVSCCAVLMLCTIPLFTAAAWRPAGAPQAIRGSAGELAGCAPRCEAAGALYRMQALLAIG